MSEQRFFNFPIMMMQGVLEGWKEKDEFLRDILYFHIANHAQKLEDLNEYEETEVQRFKRSAKFWGVKMSGNIERSYERGAELLEEFETAKVFVGINSEIFWNFYNNEKTQFEWECLAAFLALKSILGNKTFCKSNNALLYARMSGNETVKDLHSLSFSRFHRDKIILKLELEWNVKYYSRYTKGFYFGIDTTLEDLIFFAEDRRESFKAKELKKSKSEILKNYQKR